MAIARPPPLGMSALRLDTVDASLPAEPGELTVGAEDDYGLRGSLDPNGDNTVVSPLRAPTTHTETARPARTKELNLPSGIEAGSLTAALGAQPSFRSYATARFRSTARALATQPNSERATELLSMTEDAVAALKSGDMHEATRRINALFAERWTAEDPSGAKAERWAQQALASVVSRMAMDGRRSYAGISTRYAEHVRAYHAANGDKGVGPDDPTLWEDLTNGALDTLFRVSVFEPSVLAQFQERVNAPPSLVDEFTRRRALAITPHETVRLAAELAGDYAHKTDGLVCRHAAELTRELLAGAGIDARVSTIMHPFGHAYVTVNVNGEEMFVDGYFDPRGVMYQTLASVESFGFATPGATDLPVF